MNDNPNTCILLIDETIDLGGNATTMGNNSADTSKRTSVIIYGRGHVQTDMIIDADTRLRTERTRMNVRDRRG